ncbi:endolytic transglycosylase MltG [Chitinivorax tropicus]|uniref:endolytic transglycosylase MltG n=1 Tax=Chitinivorax tropicus TaxID=714531 RepID=UPI00161913F5|nr:endolytic transglycosylase MltG [Chitinivorax tropicus]
MFKLIKILLLLGIVLIVASGGWLFHFANSPLPVGQYPKTFTIRHDSNLRAVTRQLTHQKVLNEPWSFWLLARLSGRSTQLKAGSYQLTEAITPLILLDKLQKGDFHLSVVTIIEGWTFRQMREALDRHAHLRHDTQGLTDEEILNRLDIPQRNPEGLFFPDTYFAALGSSDLQILRRAHETMQQHLEEAWNERAADLPYRDAYEALIMASLIEKETGRASDRTLIGGVFVNRLKKGMRLQTDPSVIYGLGAKFDGDLRKADLQNDTPYNTYTRGGLPPTPIALPGLQSLQAAVNPARTDALYFVARGDGSSHFSGSLDEHNRAVDKYIRSR